MAPKLTKTPPVGALQITNDEIREKMLNYFYDRNSSATSRKGKKGSSIKMKDIKTELKERHAFKDQQIVSNLNYLLDQNWVKEESVEKTFTNEKGLSFPSNTPFYSITASGIDKIEGVGKFTPKRFEGINIEATGQNIITIGDGNQVNVKFKEVAEALSKFKEEVKKSGDIQEETKLEIVSDIETIQGQLAKPNPNKSVIREIWSGIEKAASVGTLTDLAIKVSPFIAALFS